jgi:hypothetical protein
VLYLTKLAPDGVLLLNISNRHLVLEPVLGAIAQAARLVALTRDDARVAERRTGKVESQWVVHGAPARKSGRAPERPALEGSGGAAGSWGQTLTSKQF